jgi:hypothetical protein
MMTTGDMAVLKGFHLIKMGSRIPSAVGFWTFKTISEKIGWMNDLIALVAFEALEPIGWK